MGIQRFREISWYSVSIYAILNLAQMAKYLNEHSLGKQIVIVGQLTGRIEKNS